MRLHRIEVANVSGIRSASLELGPGSNKGIPQDLEGIRGLNVIGEAVGVLKAQGATVYIDAGHAHWIDAAEMARRLDRSGIARAATSASSELL
jgi:hypothetical protein